MVRGASVESPRGTAEREVTRLEIIVVLLTCARLVREVATLGDMLLVGMALALAAARCLGWPNGVGSQDPPRHHVSTSPDR